MPHKLKVRRKLKVTEVSACHSPANPGSSIALWKSNDLQETTMPDFASLFLAFELVAKLGKDDPMFKEGASTFDDVDQAAQVWSLLNSLNESVQSIMMSADAGDRTALILQTVKEFALAVKGRVKKEENVDKAVLEAIKKQITSIKDPEVQKSLEILVKAVEENVTTPEKVAKELVAALKKVEDLVIANKELEEKLKKDDEDLDKDKLDKSKLPPEVQKALDDQDVLLKKAQEESKANADKLAKMEDEAVQKSITTALDGLTFVAKEAQEEFIKKLKGMDAETRTLVIGELTKADTVAKANDTLLKSLGSDTPATGSSAREKIKEVAKTIREANPSLSEHQAMGKAWEMSPDLKKQYDEERTAAQK